MEEQKKLNQLVINDTPYETKLTRKFRLRKVYAAPDPKLLNAFIPGIIRDIFITKGQTVKKGEKLLLLEAMKMKNLVTSPLDGKVKEIKVKSGEMVVKNQLVVEFE